MPKERVTTVRGMTQPELNEVFCSLLGSRNVYFQPPATVRMKYPCILYESQPMTTMHAGNVPFAIQDHYRVIVIDQNPDSAIPRKIAGMQGARAARPYVSDNLYHFPFDLWPVVTAK